MPVKRFIVGARLYSCGRAALRVEGTGVRLSLFTVTLPPLTGGIPLHLVNLVKTFSRSQLKKHIKQVKKIGCLWGV